jgi:hypothetical protein
MDKKTQETESRRRYGETYLLQELYVEACRIAARDEYDRMRNLAATRADIDEVVEHARAASYLRSYVQSRCYEGFSYAVDAYLWGLEPRDRALAEKGLTAGSIARLLRAVALEHAVADEALASECDFPARMAQSIPQSLASWEPSAQEGSPA